MVNLVVALMFLLGAGAAQATEVIFGSLPGKAIEITDLLIDGTIYDVLFDEAATAAEIYGPFPGTFTMTGNEANAAALAIVAALNAAEATLVGEDTSVDAPFGLNKNFSIGVDSGVIIVAETVFLSEGNFELGEWTDPRSDMESYGGEDRTWATFTEVPEPGATLSMVAALVTLSVVRRRGRAPTNVKAESPST